MMYMLSKIIPVPMRSTYRVEPGDQRETTTWWQWRDRIWRVRTVPA